MHLPGLNILNNDDVEDGCGVRYALHHGQLDIEAFPAVTLPASGYTFSQQTCCNASRRQLKHSEQLTQHSNSHAVVWAYVAEAYLWSVW